MSGSWARGNPFVAVRGASTEVGCTEGLPRRVVLRQSGQTDFGAITARAFTRSSCRPFLRQHQRVLDTESIMRQFARKAVTLAATGAVASGMFVIGIPSASAECYPVETGPAGVSPCASFVNDCANARLYFRAGVSGDVGPSQPVCLP